MPRIIVLIAPVFVSLFWAFALLGDYRKQAAPRRFLFKFMLLTALVFFAHFLYFAPAPDVYVYFDLPLQFTGLILFPLLHIYFRLLTVDDSISFKAHAEYLVLPVFVVFVYGIAVFNSSIPVYKAWLFNQFNLPAQVQFLDVMRKVIQTSFLVQVAYFTIANHLLINKYADKAEQFYSDVRDAKPINAKILNYSGVALGTISLILFGVGRTFLLPKDFLIFSGWSVFTFALFKFGEVGMRQKPINTDLYIPENVALPSRPAHINEIDQGILIDKILLAFRENKLHLKSDLCIMDVVQAVGSNRTSISATINQEFNQNFCVFVNSFRIEELGRKLKDSPNCTLQEYAAQCGFGSVNSMKRCVSTFYGKSFNEFRYFHFEKTPD